MTLLGCGVAIAGVDPLIAGYTALTGTPGVATPPRTVVVLGAVVAALVTGLVLSGYGALSRSGPGA